MITATSSVQIDDKTAQLVLPARSALARASILRDYFCASRIHRIQDLESRPGDFATAPKWMTREQLLQAHLGRTNPIASNSTTEDGSTAKWICYDIDVADWFLAGIAFALVKQVFPSANLEYTGGKYHAWVLFEHPLEIDEAKRLAEMVPTDEFRGILFCTNSPCVPIQNTIVQLPWSVNRYSLEPSVLLRTNLGQIYDIEDRVLVMSDQAVKSVTACDPSAVHNLRGLLANYEEQHDPIPVHLVGRTEPLRLDASDDPLEFMQRQGLELHPQRSKDLYMQRKDLGKSDESSHKSKRSHAKSSAVTSAAPTPEQRAAESRKKFDPDDISAPDQDYPRSLKRQVDQILASPVPDGRRNELLFSKGLILKVWTVYPDDYAERLRAWIISKSSNSLKVEKRLRQLEAALRHMECGLRNGRFAPTKELFQPGSRHRDSDTLRTGLGELLTPCVASVKARQQVAKILAAMLDYQAEADRLGKDRFCMSFNHLHAATGVSKPTLSRYMPFIVEGFRTVVDKRTREIKKYGLPVFTCLKKGENDRRNGVASEYRIDPRYRHLIITSDQHASSRPTDQTRS